MEKTIQKNSKQKDSSSNSVFKKRIHYHIHNGRFVENGTKDFKFDVATNEIESEDVFEEDLLLLSFPIDYFNNIDSVLKHFNLKNSSEFFIDQCKEVIAVSENHQNEKGGGKMSFQAFFHNIPESICSVNDEAIVVLAINPDGNIKDAESPVNYHIAGYIHANVFHFKPDPSKDQVEMGYYYNMLRISEKEVNGINIYRRKKVFSLMFSILHSLTEQNDVKFAFACMGKENESIKAALHVNSNRFKKHYERLPFTIFSQVNLFSGSKRYSQELVEITHNEIMLKKMYQMVHEKMSKYLFFNHLTEESFLSLIKKLVGYSKSSGVFMIPDKNGDIAAASIAMNYGDFFEFKIKNPKGIFRIVQATGVMKNFLRLLMAVGEPKSFEKLLKGLSYKYHKEYNVGVSFLPTFKGDPFYNVYKSILDDKYMFFVICRDKAWLQELKERSADAKGNPRLFVDHPIT
ncbi:MAG: hypothetical protein R2753_04390 [Chitinophagales bacterium]